MKLSKITFVIIGVVVLGVGFGYLYMQYSRQQDQQEQIRSQLSANQAALAKLVSESQDWQAQVAKLQEDLDKKKAQVPVAQAALSAARSVWPRTETQSIEYDEEIFALADGWNLPIQLMSAGEGTGKTVNGIDFTTTSFSVSVSGQPIQSGFEDAGEYQDYVYASLDDILGFINDLVTDQFFDAATIDDVNVTVPSMLPEPDKDTLLEGEGLEVPSASLSVTVYRYTGG